MKKRRLNINDAMSVKRLFMMSFLLLTSFFVQEAYAGNEIQNDTCLVNANGRVLVEIHHSYEFGKYYHYSINDITAQIAEIKRTKKSFDSEGIFYPAPNNYLMAKNELKRFHHLVDSLFMENNQQLTISEIKPRAYLLVDNNGNVYCKDIQTLISLRDIFTSEQILNIFDTLCNFKFTAPVLASPPHPEDCYIEF